MNQKPIDKYSAIKDLMYYVDGRMRLLVPDEKVKMLSKTINVQNMLSNYSEDDYQTKAIRDTLGYIDGRIRLMLPDDALNFISGK